MNARSLETRIPLETYLAEHTPARVRPAGAHAAYSNWGTTLAAYIVQEVSGLLTRFYTRNKTTVSFHIIRNLCWIDCDSRIKECENYNH